MAVPRSCGYMNPSRESRRMDSVRPSLSKTVTKERPNMNKKNEKMSRESAQWLKVYRE